MNSTLQNPPIIEEQNKKTFSLKKFHEILFEKLRSQFQLINSPPIPRLSLIVEQAEKGEDRGDSRLPLNLHLAVDCLLPKQTQNVECILEDIATQIFIWLHDNRFGFSRNLLTQPEQMTIESGKSRDNSNGQNSFASWRVRWEQTVYLGPSVWAEEVFLKESTQPQSVCFESLETKEHDINYKLCIKQNVIS